MSVDYPLIGSRIKTARKRFGATQEWLAERLSVSVGFVSQLERGITKINLDTLSRIASELECDITYFISGVDEQQNNYLQSELYETINSMTQSQKSALWDACQLICKYIS